MRTKRRALVLTNEAARHPFRASLPAHVFAGLAGDAATVRAKPIDLGDWRGFLTAYCCAFIATMIFIA